MFRGFFNYDNPVWRFIGKFGDLIILNILWMICSIPIFTIGASTTALYYVTLKLARDEDGYTIKSFFRSFVQNFKQATIMWLIMLFAGLIIGFDIYFFAQMTGISTTVKTVIVAIFGALALVYLCMMTFLFPLQARFYNPVKRTLFNSFFISIRHFFQTLGIIALDAAVLVTGYFSMYYMPQISVLFLLFGFPLIAFMNSYMLTPIFKKYMPKTEEERDDHEMRPLFAEDDAAAGEAAALEDKAAEAEESAENISE